MSRGPWLAGLAAVVSLFPGGASAEGWDGSFPPAATASHLVGAGSGVVVVAATEGADCREAAAAMQVSLREEGGIPLVMDGTALGPVTDLDDAAIVKRSAHLPVERIAVVRYYPGSGGAPGSAVVTVYDKEGSALQGFAVRSGEVLAAREEESPGKGVSAKAVQVVGTLREDRKSTIKKSNEEFDRLHIWFAERISVTTSGFSAMVTSEGIPYQGKAGKKLEGAAFYEVVGREDLASSYRTWNAWKQGLTWGGLAVSTAGLVWMVITPSRCESAVGDSCFEDNLIGGLAVSLVGTTSTYVGIAINPHPVDNRTMKGLAEEYNDGLRSRLGLTASSSEGEEQGSQLRLGLVSLRDGRRGLGLTGSF